MTERVKKAVDIYLDALNEGTLAKGTCIACAVGNLVANGKGGQVERIVDWAGIRFKCSVPNAYWRYAFMSTPHGQSVHKDNFCDIDVLKDVAATDFSLEELMKIELTFENNTNIDFQDYKHFSAEQIREDQIKGLSAVVKVMLSFDSEEEIQDKEVYDCFTSKAELISI
jgi:hypothetical protein